VIFKGITAVTPDGIALVWDHFAYDVESCGLFITPPGPLLTQEGEKTIARPNE
jgi:hypothetical protein